MKVILKSNRKETKFLNLECGDIFSTSINGILWMKVSPFVGGEIPCGKNAITINGTEFYWFDSETEVFRKKAELIIEDE